MTSEEELARRRLFGWLKGTPPWPDRHQEIEELHLQGLAADLGVTPEQLTTILPFVPEESFANAQIALDEDFLTYHFDGDNVIDAYLREDGLAENPAMQAYLVALRDSRISLYEVLDVVDGSHWLLRDRLQDQSPIHVADAMADDRVTADHSLAARVVTVGERQFMSEGVLILPNAVAAVVADIFLHQHETFDDQFPILAAEHGIPLNEETRLRMQGQLMAGIVTGAYFMHLLGNVMSTLDSLDGVMSGSRPEGP